MRKSSADSTMECPECKQATFSKMLSAPSFQLNGTGWYATDFKNNNKPAAASSDAKSDATAKTETKAASQDASA